MRNAYYQNGSKPFLRSGYWYIRYYEDRQVDGVVVRQRPAVRLIEAIGTYKEPRKRELDAAREFMHDKNARQVTGAAAISFSTFVENVFLTNAKATLRKSTSIVYAGLWRVHVKPWVLNQRLQLQDVRPITITKLLGTIVENRAKTGKPPLSRATVSHIRAFLSSVFAMAIKLEYYSGRSNPVRDCYTPKTSKAKPRRYYSLREELSILSALEQEGQHVAATAFACACFAGLRYGEINALHWEDYGAGDLLDDTGQKFTMPMLYVSRSLHQGIAQETKTPGSEAAVPVIGVLAGYLNRHRVREGNPTSGPIFRSPYSDCGYLSLANMTLRILRPLLDKCKVCGQRSGTDHKLYSWRAGPHEWQQGDLPLWQGWHGGRRGLATALTGLGVNLKIISAILRHSSTKVTELYVQHPVEQQARGLDRLDAEITRLEGLSSHGGHQSDPNSGTEKVN